MLCRRLDTGVCLSLASLSSNSICSSTVNTQLQAGEELFVVGATLASQTGYVGTLRTIGRWHRSDFPRGALRALCKSFRANSASWCHVMVHTKRGGFVQGWIVPLSHPPQVPLSVRILGQNSGQEDPSSNMGTFATSRKLMDRTSPLALPQMAPKSLKA